MNKKAQFFYGGLIDASTLPKWLLYPLIIMVILVLLFSLFFMGSFAYSCLIKDNCYMPFGFWHFGYMPVMIGGYKQSYSECFINGVKTNCSESQTPSTP